MSSRNEVEDTKGVFKNCKSKIPKGYSKSVNLRYQRGIQNPYIEDQQLRVLN
jgi:hypothetical protein